MSTLTEHDHSILRDLITQRLRELRIDIHEAEQSKRQVAANAAHEVTDFKEAAAQSGFTALDEVQERRDIHETEQLEAALQRLDQGEYGDCTDCGIAIPVQRLRAAPATLRCARCQTLFERTPGGAR